MLRVNNLSAFYDRTQVLHEISLRVEEREIVGLVGANGAGKTTTLLGIIGIKTRTEGEIWLNEERIDRLPAYERVRRAIVLIPERRRLFPFMTVLENLELGAYLPGPREDRNTSLQMVFDLLPVLAERRHQIAGSLSGGEQQMLALARALMLAPRILLIDEPSVGLAPVLVSRTIDKIKELKDQYNLTVLMAEQNFPQALRIADRGYVIVHGQIAFEGRSADELNNNELIRKFYLGL